MGFDQSMTSTHIIRRNRMILAAAKEGHCYRELARTYGLSPPMISVICTQAGFRKKRAWNDAQKQKIRGIARRHRKAHNI
jgi:hypothetical protein